MKSVVLASALAAAGFLVGSASGRPLNYKRELVTEVVYVTETVADVIVYVDQDGAPYSTTTTEKSDVATSVIAPPTTAETSSLSSEPQASSSSATPAQAPLPTSSEEPSSTVAAPTSEPTVADVKDVTTTPASSSTTADPTVVDVKNVTTPAPSSTTVESSSVTPAPTQDPEPTSEPSSATSAAPDVPAKVAASGDTLPLGVTYDPYSTNSECKGTDTIASEFSRMKDYGVVRIYGMDCDIIPLAIQNCVKNGQKLMGGSYVSGDGHASESLDAVINAYKNAINEYAGRNWDVMQLFSVENEQVNDKKMAASQVVDAINNARSQLRSAGYNGPVGAVETVPATLDNPAICEASDVAMVNCHAFFDRNTEAKNAGTFVKGQIDRVRTACNKRVVVTESGWPHQGNANGAAVPSPENQRLALESIRSNFDHDMFLFHAFDTPWKADTASTFNAERYWGVIQ